MSSHGHFERDLAIVYEHPEWFQPLFAELDKRGIPYDRVKADALLIDPETTRFPKLLVNRMSPSAWTRGHAHGLFAVRDLLSHAEANGVSVVNGSHAYAVELSKSRQLDIMRQAGVKYPKARVVNHASRLAEAAHGLKFPVVTKPNIGGSGAGIVKHDSMESLLASKLDLGLDFTGLVQEFLPAREGSIVRVEILDGKPLYAIKIFPDNQSFNLCPADICQVDAAPAPTSFEACPVPSATAKKKLRIERYEAPQAAIAGALKLAELAKLDVGGVEYLVDDRTGEVHYYDINALSNFVSDAVNVVGFDPFARFVDYLERRLAAA